MPIEQNAEGRLSPRGKSERIKKSMEDSDPGHSGSRQRTMINDSDCVFFIFFWFAHQQNFVGFRLLWTA